MVSSVSDSKTVSTSRRMGQNSLPNRLPQSPSRFSHGFDGLMGRFILAATILASSMAFIDGTVVNVALPFLQARLNATALDVQWVVEAYALFLSALLLIGGSLGDQYGRRRIFISGVVLFAAASGAC